MLENAVTALRAHPVKEAKIAMRANDRMAGSVPVWAGKTRARDNVLHKLAAAMQNERPKFDHALSYRPQPEQPAKTDTKFSVGDLVDMVNPLQHLPVIGSIYREVTGDEIKPVSRLIGGTVFGGPLGAAGGMANIVVEHETGRDIGENVMAFFKKPEDISPAAHWARIAPASGEGSPADYPADKPAPLEPDSRLTTTAPRDQNAPGAYSRPQDLPGTVLRYVDLGAGQRKVYKYIPEANSRMAGGVTHIYTEPDTRRV